MVEPLARWKASACRTGSPRLAAASRPGECRKPFARLELSSLVSGASPPNEALQRCMIHARWQSSRPPQVAVPQGISVYGNGLLHVESFAGVPGRWMLRS